jgi:hypothetical protein
MLHGLTRCKTVAVWKLLWHGSPQATAVLKAGAPIFGLAFPCIGISFLYWSTQTYSLFIRILGTLLSCLDEDLCEKRFFRQCWIKLPRFSPVC